MMADLTTGLVNAAKNIQRPISLAAAALLVLYLIFSQIIGKIQAIDQTIVSAIVNWIGIIALVAVVMSLMTYALPLFLGGRARVGELEVGTPKVTPGASARPSRARKRGSGT